MLDYLYTKITYNEIDVPSLQSTKTSLVEVAKQINYPYKDVYEQHHILPDTQASCIPDKDQHYIVLMKNGIDAVIDKHWLREGEKEVNERIYDKTKWAIPLIALIITGLSLWYTANKMQEVSKIQEQLNQVKTELNELKEQKSTPSQDSIQQQISYDTSALNKAK